MKVHFYAFTYLEAHLRGLFTAWAPPPRMQPKWLTAADGFGADMREPAQKYLGGEMGNNPPACSVP